MKRKPVLVKNGSTLYLRLVVLALGAVVLATCLFVLPPVIATDKTGMYRPILLGLYVTAVPFFYALYHTLKLLGYIDKNTAFSDLSVDALRRIKYCGVTIAGLFAAGSPYIYHVADKDDTPGVLAIALVIIGASIAVAVFAAVLERLLQNAIAIKSENDLTV